MSHRPSSSWILCTVLATACGDDGNASTSETSSGGSTSDPSPVSTSGETSTSSTETTGGGATATSDDESSTGRSSNPSTSSSGSSSEGGLDTSTGSTTTGGRSNEVYSAIALPGGLDRIRIHKANLDDDTCTWVVLVAPAIPGMYPALVVTEGWAVESVAINDAAKSCDTDTPAMFGAEAALDATGTVEFGALGGTGIYPCAIDIEAMLDFQGLLPSIPTTDIMSATKIPVTGC